MNQHNFCSFTKIVKVCVVILFFLGGWGNKLSECFAITRHGQEVKGELKVQKQKDGTYYTQ